MKENMALQSSAHFSTPSAELFCCSDRTFRSVGNLFGLSIFGNFRVGRNMGTIEINTDIFNTSLMLSFQVQNNVLLFSTLFSDTSYLNKYDKNANVNKDLEYKYLYILYYVLYFVIKKQKIAPFHFIVLLCFTLFVVHMFY